MLRSSSKQSGKSIQCILKETKERLRHDAKIFKKVRCRSDCSQLQADLDKLVLWAHKWQMVFKRAQMRLAAGLHPDLLGDLERFLRPSSAQMRYCACGLSRSAEPSVAVFDTYTDGVRCCQRSVGGWSKEPTWLYLRTYLLVIVLVCRRTGRRQP